MDALATLFSRALPRTGTAGGDPVALWQRILALTYRCELRPESGDRGRTPTHGNPAPRDFRVTGRAALDAAPTIEAASTPALAGPSWALRIALVASRGPRLLRLLKALQTFDGGLDIMRPGSWSATPAGRSRFPMPSAGDPGCISGPIYGGSGGRGSCDDSPPAASVRASGWSSGNKVGDNRQVERVAEGAWANPSRSAGRAPAALQEGKPPFLPSLYHLDREALARARGPLAAA
ncbi:MAG: hypothetical protein U5R48_12610 [Gammaproteobacteria bacterium]|nr:hypothetical protein [Gammaproteobacteria bacterium]